MHAKPQIRPVEADPSPRRSSGAEDRAPGSEEAEMALDGLGEIAPKKPMPDLERPKAFASAAVSLFGDDWVGQAAHDLDVNRRTIERLARAARHGEAFVVHDVWLMELADMLDDDAALLIAKAVALRSHVNERPPVPKVAAEPPSSAQASAPAPHPTVGEPARGGWGMDAQAAKSI